MKLKLLYVKEYTNVYVEVSWPNLGMSWFLVFDYNQFYERYHPNHQEFVNMPLLKEDIVDTFIDTNGGIPFTKEEMLKDIIVNPHSDLIRKVEL